MGVRSRATDVLRRLAGRPTHSPTEKFDAESNFWTIEIGRIHEWYRGERSEHYRTPSPTSGQRVHHENPILAAILTWHRLHQMPKYAKDLKLDPDAFMGRRVLDVGSGPMPSGEVFRDCELFNLDPLFPRYLEAGWPLHIYREGSRFVHGYAERMPLETDSFDAVISVNAIDHVDDFDAAADEIRRTLKPGGDLVMHVHYHEPTPTEPLALSDAALMRAFRWCEGLRKCGESREKSSWVAPEGESYVLWSTMHG